MPKNSYTSYNIKEIIGYTLPKLYTGKDWYVGFTSYDPAKDKMCRKKIRLNHIKKVTDRRRYAELLILRLTHRLEEGWNPWIVKENILSYATTAAVFHEYRNYLTKLLSDGSLRKPTMRSYISRMNMLEKYNAQRSEPIKFIYQLDQQFLSDFINYVYVELDNTITTRNHYVVWLSNLTGWMVERTYLKNKPTEGLKTIRNTQEKSRTIINPTDMARLKDWCMQYNKHYLLACYMIYYMLIRPKEISMLRIRDISLKNQTVFVAADVSKNKHSDYVTLPLHVINLMLDLKIFDYPQDCYIFSDNFKPGMKYRHSKHFGDYWVLHVKKALRFPSEYKFYSLKDTGITNMLHTCDVLSVRDQARHSDISITNIYAAKSNSADKNLTNYVDDSF